MKIHEQLKIDQSAFLKSVKCLTGCIYTDLNEVLNNEYIEESLVIISKNKKEALIILSKLYLMRESTNYNISHSIYWCCKAIVKLCIGANKFLNKILSLNIDDKYNIDVEEELIEETINVLLSSEKISDHRLTYLLCSTLKKSENARVQLALLYYNGIGTSKDLLKCRQTLKSCNSIINHVAIPSLFQVNPKLLEYDKIFLYDSEKFSNDLIAFCFQNNILIDGIKNNIDDDSAYLCIQSNMQNENIFTVKPGKNSAFILNPDISNYTKINVPSKEHISLLNNSGVNVSTYNDDSKYINDELYLTNSIQNYKKLIEKKISIDNIIFDYTAYNSLGIVIDYQKKEIDVKKLIMRLIRGSYIYSNLSKTNEHYIMSGSPALGDNCRILCKQKTLSNGDSSKEKKIIVSLPSKDLICLFNYEGIVLKNEDIFSLDLFLAYHTLFKRSNVDVIYSTSLFPNFDGKSLLNSYSGKMRNSDWLSKICGSPTYQKYDPLIYAKIKNNEMYRGKILINPYGNYMASAYPQMYREIISYFENLVSILIDAGYSIYTNVIKNQKPLLNTKPFNLSIKDTVATCNLFHAIITTYTGLMDVLILSKCNLIVILPDNTKTRKEIATTNGNCNYFEYEYVKIKNDVKVLLDTIKNFEDLPEIFREDITKNINVINYTDEYVKLIEEYPKCRAIVLNYVLKDLNTEEQNTEIKKLEKLSSNNYIAKYLLGMLIEKGFIEKYQKTYGLEIIETVVGLGQKWIDDDFLNLIWRNSQIKEQKYLNTTIYLADRGNSFAQYSLSLYYLNKENLGNEIHLSEYWARKSYINNYPGSWNQLFDVLWEINTFDSKKEMIEIIKNFTKLNDARSLLRLGRAYRDGKGVNKDLNKAEESMKEAIKYGATWAKVELDKMLLMSPPTSTPGN